MSGAQTTRNSAPETRQSAAGRVVALDAIAKIAQAARAAGKTVVLTNGCFDLLHVGHTRLLERCQELGDVLIVGVNADESVRRLKGPGRPLVLAAERAELLAALRAVDYVTIFPELTAERLASLVAPDVYVKGADYAAGDDVDAARLPEAAVVRAHGGRVVLLPLTPGRSTSGLIERIKEPSAISDQQSATSVESSGSRSGA